MELHEMLGEYGIVCSKEQLMQFNKFYELLIEWNGFMNLTGITDYSEVNCKHFTDSLAAVKVVDFQNDMRVIDVGTGAGFPGIPLKIVYPELRVTLLDSLGKRVKFLNEVIQSLELKTIEAVHGRAEDFIKQNGKRESYDLCVSRAVANLASLSEYCLPYVNTGGYFISYKSGDVDSELEESEKAIRILGGQIETVEKFNLPGTDISRSLVKIKKTKETPKKYPRKAGTPTKEPLV